MEIFMHMNPDFNLCPIKPTTNPEGNELKNNNQSLSKSICTRIPLVNLYEIIKIELQSPNPAST